MLYYGLWKLASASRMVGSLENGMTFGELDSIFYTSAEVLTHPPLARTVPTAAYQSVLLGGMPCVRPGFYAGEPPHTYLPLYATSVPGIRTRIGNMGRAT